MDAVYCRCWSLSRTLTTTSPASCYGERYLASESAIFSSGTYGVYAQTTHILCFLLKTFDFSIFDKL